MDGALQTYPQADLLVLSEYAFATPVPDSVLGWCKSHRRYLILGAVDPLPTPPDAHTNTAFVIDPDGRICFKQGKSVPVQFFSDGLPATSQRVWNSPWGNIGICICYDLSYTRITDTLIRQGAVALIVPTMDAISWGSQEHLLHSRIAPTRAAEYQLPIFRLCSSGISQVVLSNGVVAVSAPFPGEGQMIAAALPMSARPTLPLDRVLAPVCVFITAIFVLIISVRTFRFRRKRFAIIPL